MTRKEIPVFDQFGKILGHVSQSATSIGANKIAKGTTEMSNRFGTWGWVKKATRRTTYVR